MDWGVGDFTNLLGCILTRQLPFQVRYSLMMQPPHIEPQTALLRLTSRHTSSSSTSAYWASITTTEKPPRQLHRIFDHVPHHSAQGYLKTEAIIEASPSQLRMSLPPQQSWLLIKRSKAPVPFIDYPEGASMKSPNQSDHQLK